MTKRLYIIGRRHGPYAVGDEVLLSEDEAQALDNEAPGIIVGIAKDEGDVKAESEKLAKPRVKDEETSK